MDQLEYSLILLMGIFVDINLDLYVADYYNHRIQLFRLGELNGITVAGNTSLNTTITLSLILVELFWMVIIISLLWMVAIIVLLDQDQMVFDV